jgi:uncharacterized protein (TIGR02996 family)
MKTFMNWLNENEQGFIDAIRANPNDLTLWLVYADWLEERGDPRAEQIRNEVQSITWAKGRIRTSGLAASDPPALARCDV